MGIIDRLHGVTLLLKQDRIAVLNGVAVRSKPWYDGHDHYPEHKDLLARTVREHVDDGDWVRTVGGGYGVVEVHAARAGGSVTTYEAAAEMVPKLHETAFLNNVDLSVRWAQIGTVHDAYGSTAGVQRIDPHYLVGDVLVLDCEGAELDILPQPEFGTVIVETHPKFGADTATVRELLSGPSTVVGADPQDGHVVVRHG